MKNGTPLLVVASRTLHALVPVSEVALAGLAEGGQGSSPDGCGCRRRVRRPRPANPTEDRPGDPHR
ncbi:MAG: hypothetical protein MZV63_25945 [Marinilabiliales bacterium]|nr:hypothetical protein [Marinilabiliales bacterium]